MRLHPLSISLLSVVAASCAAPASVRIGVDDDVRADIIHSDLPLFRDTTENMWPQHFYDEDRFGCVSRVAFGEWVLREQGGGEPRWYSVQNYGVFHCWAVVGEAYERRKLEAAEARPAFFVLVDDIDVNGEQRELWALQIGARPGSEYLFLSRSPREGLIDAFEVLQTRCPSANVRDAGSLDILLTRYCALNSRADLLRLTRQMAQLPAMGTLTLVRSDDEDAE